jgi:CubicO group peptidase (beta-lactamase class C family)
MRSKPITGSSIDCAARLATLARMTLSRRALLASAGALAFAGQAHARTTGLDPTLMAEALAAGEVMDQLRSLIVAREGEELEAHVFRGPSLDTPVNVKSVSKTIMSALAGAAIARGILEGVDQKIAPILADSLPPEPDPRLEEITVDHLLTMRAGLDRTSGRNYGAWVLSDDWTKDALAQPFVDEPGGRMLYSTGSFHLLSAVLTELSGESTLANAREWLGRPLGIEVPPWTRSPEGVYMGGNEMALSPRALLAFCEMYRNNGVYGATEVLPASWVETSWIARTRSPFSRHDYGYGWFIANANGHAVYYARGYGGQMAYVVPDLAMTVVMTSDPNSPGRGGHVEALNALLADKIVPAAERGA